MKKEIRLKEYKGMAFYDFTINSRSNFVITSYWWGRGNINKNSRKGLTYDALADRLIKDCIKSKCNYIIVEVPEFAVPGGYQKAINFKPSFILSVMDNIPSNFERIVYIDTDMAIHKHPSIFDMEGYDFMGYNWNWEPRQMFNSFPFYCWDPYNLHTSGGLLLFAKNGVAKKLLKEWDAYVQKYPGKAEDRMLSIPFNDDEMITKLRCFWLPDEYFWLPFFYEYDETFVIEKRYQKVFKKKLGIKFKGEETVKELNFKELFDVQKSHIVISHPEMLTTEEMAAKQGADLNRIPLEWFKSQGRKKKCLTSDEKYVINENFEVENNIQKKQMKYVWDWLSASKFVKIENKKLDIPIYKLDILEKSIESSGILFMTIDKNEDEDEVEEWKRVIEDMDSDYIILQKNEKSLASIIYNVIKKYKRNVMYIDITSKFEEDFFGINMELEDVDIACINANSYPNNYKGIGMEKCYDPRFLKCVSDSIFYFQNNRFGKNILKAWNNIKIKKLSESQKLSIAFNKYGFITSSRVQWLDPGYAYNKKYVNTKGDFTIKIINKNENYPKWNEKVDMYDDLQQCGDKRGVSLKDEGAYPTHYKSSKFKSKMRLKK